MKFTIKHFFSASATALLFASSLTYAADSFNKLGPEFLASNLGKGPYAGIMFGGGNINVRFQANVRERQLYDDAASIGNGMAGVILGYGETIGHWYGGLELSANENKGTVTFSRPPILRDDHATYIDSITVKNYYNADIIPGYFINSNWLVYGRVGYAIGKADFTQDRDTGRNTVTEYSNSTSLDGGRLGVGIDTPLNNYVSVGADYIYTNYFNNSIYEANNTQRYIITPITNVVFFHLKTNFG